MWNQLLNSILDPDHRGRLLGISLGLLIGLSAAIFGVVKTLFITVTVVVGYFIGKRVDENGTFKDLLDKVINRDRY